MGGAGDIQPAFIDAEGFHQIGIFLIDLIDQTGVFAVRLTMGRHQHQIGAFALGLPDGLGRLDAVAFGQFVFSEDDAVAAFRVAADGHRHLFQFGTQDAFYRCVKAVAVTV